MEGTEHGNAHRSPLMAIVGPRPMPRCFCMAGLYHHAVTDVKRSHQLSQQGHVQVLTGELMTLCSNLKDMVLAEVGGTVLPTTTASSHEPRKLYEL